MIEQQELKADRGQNKTVRVGICNGLENRHPLLIVFLRKLIFLCKHVSWSRRSLSNVNFYKRWERCSSV